MKNSLRLLIGGLCLSMVLSCGNATGNGALIGGGGGAVLGGVIGALVSGSGDKTKGAAIGAAIGGAVGAGTGALIGRHMDKVKAELAERQLNAKIESVKDANGLDALKVTFDSGILFESSKYDLNAASQANLLRLAKTMQHYNTCALSIYGHTDSSGSDKINDPLSVNRATSVANYLVNQGVAQNHLVDLLGYGSRQPVADNTTEAGKQANRRVEVFIYASEQMIKDANAGKL